ncbi:MAG: hypoxanthine phosphoribosyltransferase [Chloroflexota bacterium]
MDAEPECQVVFPREEIAAAVCRMAAAIRQDYRDQHPLLIGVLKGSFMFLADLVRELNFPLELEFVTLSSYGSARQTSGRVRLVRGLRGKVRGRAVLVVEDIVDTGLTIAFLLDYLRRQRPASLRLGALLDKPSKRQTPVTIDYLGFTAPDKFLVGYGLDWGERFRYLPDICFVAGDD